VVFVDGGRLLLDAPREEAVAWLGDHRPAYAAGAGEPLARPAPSDAVVTIEDAWFAYSHTPVLTGVELEVRRGEIVALEGPNGSGKSTLAKLAAGLLDAQAGSVRRSGRAGYLPQDPGRHLVAESVLEEVAFGVNGDRGRSLAALGTAHLAWAAGRHPRDLSSGERERLGLAAVAVAEPDLLVLDEPTRGLDPERKAELGSWLERYAEAGRGVLVATHDRSFPAHRRIALGREAIPA
jgi:energy-coupling factor transport system ATP-binding protein